MSDHLLYQPKQNTIVPAFVTASSGRFQKWNSATLRNSLSGSAPSPSKELKIPISIDQQLSSSKDPINLRNGFPSKIKSEQSDGSANPRSIHKYSEPECFNVLKYCNPAILDKALKKKQKSGTSFVQIQIGTPQTAASGIQKRQNNFFSRKQFKVSFTLSQLRTPNSSEVRGIREELINNNKINKVGKLQEQQAMEGLGTAQNQKQPKFDQYTSKETIRNHDMVFNVQRLIRLQQKREEELAKNKMNDPGLQLEIIKRKNQIQCLLANTKKLDDLKKLSGGILVHMSQQERRAEQIFEQFKTKLGVK